MTTEDPQKIKARLNDVAADVRDVYQDAVCCINELQAEVSELRVELFDVYQRAYKAERERDELQAERDRAVEDYNYWYKRWEHAIYFGTPRPITAEELKVGQYVCFFAPGRPLSASGRVDEIDKDGTAIFESGFGWDVEDTDTIIILADAPDEQQEPERLTVADLENAAVGSVLSGLYGHRAWTKGDDGLWGNGGACTVRSDRFEPTLPERTLTHPTPTPAPVTAETIRQSEPGTTYTDKDLDTWEWDGETMRFHNTRGELSPKYDEDTPNYVISAYGPLTRSTAAPRGDYGKAEVPSGHSVQIDPAVYETMFSDQKFLARLHDEIRTAKVVRDD